MKTIQIGDQNELFAEILPDYGGMLVKLVYKGNNIIYFDKNIVSHSPVLSGGCPILFPFPSRTENDRYKIDGKEYSMPFHGLVKNAAFGVKSVNKNSATIYINNNETSLKDHYPFEYELEIMYRINGNTIDFNATVFNRTSRKLPHYLGWHHYFLASKKKLFSIDHGMEKYLDYTVQGEPTKGNGQRTLDFNEKIDFVFYKKTKNDIRIESKSDHYRAIMTMDDRFESIVICSFFDNTVTVEPWIGLPNSINMDRYVQWIAPGSSECYTVALTIETI